MVPAAVCSVRGLAPRRSWRLVAPSPHRHGTCDRVHSGDPFLSRARMQREPQNAAPSNASLECEEERHGGQREQPLQPMLRATAAVSETSGGEATARPVGPTLGTGERGDLARSPPSPELPPPPGSASTPASAQREGQAHPSQQSTVQAAWDKGVGANPASTAHNSATRSGVVPPARSRVWWGGPGAPTLPRIIQQQRKHAAAIGARALTAARSLVDAACRRDAPVRGAWRVEK